MTATFPLRPLRLAFAICGWRLQNNMHEIKYSVCVCVCNVSNQVGVLKVPLYNFKMK